MVDIVTNAATGEITGSAGATIDLSGSSVNITDIADNYISAIACST